MLEKKITIVTACGEGFGQGHLQRMMALTWFLSRNNTIKLNILNKPSHLPPAINRYCESTIDSDCELIIRDMRDSSIDDIISLKQIAPVLVLDDQGPGKTVADYSINLLPHYNIKLDIPFIMNHFIYGYSFMKSISDFGDITLNKDIDISLYLGHRPEKALLDRIISMLPSGSTIAILQGDNKYTVSKGIIRSCDTISYSELLLRSKVLITYFGITLFEGHISECKLIVINPTEYHSLLTKFSKSMLDLIDIGTFNSFNIEIAREIITNNIEHPLSEGLSTKTIYQMIISNLNNLSNHLNTNVS